MVSSLWEAIGQLSLQHQVFFAFALVIAFGFEFINGFHDTANAVTTVIYTGTLRPNPAVLYSGVCNFFGVLLGGSAVAFSIVKLLPVDLLIDSASTRSIVMVVSLLLAGVIWNLSTWWYGLPVSSSHTLIGAILGVGLANSLITHGNASGVSWSKATGVGLSLLISPVIGFVAAAALLLAMKRFVPEPNLYHPPGEGDNPPGWVRGVLLATCGGVSFAHGSNDGQKGMGLILLALIGFLPTYYALDLHHPRAAHDVHESAVAILAELERETVLTSSLRTDLYAIIVALEGKTTFFEVKAESRWKLRSTSQHDSCPLVGGGRHDVGESVGHSRRYGQEDRPRVDPHAPRRHSDIRDIVHPGRRLCAGSESHKSGTEPGPQECSRPNACRPTEGSVQHR